MVFHSLVIERLVLLRIDQIHNIVRNFVALLSDWFSFRLMFVYGCDIIVISLGDLHISQDSSLRVVKIIPSDFQLEDEINSKRRNQIT